MASRGLPGGFILEGRGSVPFGQHRAGTSSAVMSVSEQFSPPLNETLFAHGSWLPLSPGDEWGISVPQYSICFRGQCQTEGYSS